VVLLLVVVILFLVEVENLCVVMFMVMDSLFVLSILIGWFLWIVL